MIVVERVSTVAQLLLRAASSCSTAGFRQLHETFEEGTHPNDVYDTLEAASRALCDSQLAIYSALMAKNADACPGIGFYDIFNNLRREEFWAVTGHNDLHQLSEKDRRTIAAIEYQHARENFSVQCSASSMSNATHR